MQSFSKTALEIFKLLNNHASEQGIMVKNQNLNEIEE